MLLHLEDTRDKEVANGNELIEWYSLLSLPIYNAQYSLSPGARDT